jgi:hypothetical protein
MLLANEVQHSRTFVCDQAPAGASASARNTANAVAQRRNGFDAGFIVVLTNRYEFCPAAD